MHEYSRSLIDSRVGGTYPFEQYQYSATTGNLSSKAGVSYTYAAQSSSCPAGALSKPHAVTTAGSNTYCYDQNGNMVRRTLGGSVYNLTYDAENHLTVVSGATTATFVYDGDGNRVKGTVAGVTTIYIGNYFEWICRRSLRSFLTVEGSNVRKLNV